MTGDPTAESSDSRELGLARVRGVPGNPLMYDTMGAVQLAILALFFGLRERHKLLEIGAGTLRAARFLIPYLAEGHYCGVEPREANVQLGLEHALGLEMAKRKSPRFLARADYRFGEFGETFDYALAYSLLTHVPPSDIPRIFARLSECFHASSMLVATAVLGDDEEIVDQERWTEGFNRYRWTRFEDAAARAGMRALRLGHYFQDWFVAFSEGNEVAIAGAEQMARVDWQRVQPKWEVPEGWSESIARRARAAARARPRSPGADAEGESGSEL